MSKRIVVIEGHPDCGAPHFGHALAASYIEAARSAGHDVTAIQVGQLDFPLLHSRTDWESAALPESLRPAQRALGAADHLLLLYPLWLGSMPALLKAFLEQILRPGFAFSTSAKGDAWGRLLTGKSARIVVTMGMPALIYRWYFGAHSVKSVARNILGFCGMHPIRVTLVGSVEAQSQERRQKWLREMRRQGTLGR